MSPVPAAVVQMTSTADVEGNLSRAEALVEKAAERGARFVALPENFAFLRSEGQPIPEPQTTDGPWVSRMAQLARDLELTLLLGSIPEKVPGEKRIRNTSVLLGPDGSTLALYRKIHLFDIDLPGMEHLKESRAVEPGTEVVVAESPLGPLGLSVCYDLRFPELYREFTRRGARTLCVPSAFTERTGKAHWEVLLRARAIENLAFVVAPGPGRAPRRRAVLTRSRHDRGPLGRGAGPGPRGRRGGGGGGAGLPETGPAPAGAPGPGPSAAGPGLSTALPQTRSGPALPWTRPGSES